MSVLERVQEAQGKHGALSTEALLQESSHEHIREYVDKLKNALVERLGLDTLSDLVQSEGMSDVKEELTVSCRAIINDERFSALLSQDREIVISSALDEICGFGPIQQLLDDQEVSEIMINGPHALFYEREGKMYPSDLSFESKDQIMLVIDRILAPLGRRLDISSPLVNARLPNGDRVNAVADGIALEGPSVTIRKFSDRITSLSELVSLGSLPAWYAQLLSWAVKTRKDIAVAGGTGSGKTTLLNALSCEIGKDERIIIIEDSAELRFEMHPNLVRLEARDNSIEGSGEITIRDLVKNALRMRPDRIVIGEVRDGAALDLLQAMNTGHDGSLTTLHAGSADEAILRLVLMARFGMNLPTDIIEEQVATALDLLVMSERFPSGKRLITTLSEVRRKPDGKVGLSTCISFNRAQQSWTLEYEPKFIDTSLQTGLLSEQEVEKWRASILSLPALS